MAFVLHETLLERTLTAARGRLGASAFGRLVGARVTDVQARGKHLLISFDGGLTLHTHLGMHGSWHRYRPGEAWRRAPSRAAAVLETANIVCVAFDAPTVELIETRALAIHPVLSRLGPDASAPDFDASAALHRLGSPELADMAIGDALLNQGVGNVIRSEVCFIERVHPFRPVGDVEVETRRGLVERAAVVLRANRGGGRRVTTAPGTPGSLYVYGRTGRPCRRCETLISSRISAAGRRVYWCAGCQR